MNMNRRKGLMALSLAAVMTKATRKVSHGFAPGSRDDGGQHSRGTGR